MIRFHWPEVNLRHRLGKPEKRREKRGQRAELGWRLGVAPASVSTAVGRTRERKLKKKRMRRDYEKLIAAVRKKSQTATGFMTRLTSSAAACCGGGMADLVLD
jgi:hypothetical protein